MTTNNLVEGADMAYPPQSYATLPSTVRVILGYVGGQTPHAWTWGEIAAAEASGRQWWPIWTAPNPKAVLSAATGEQDGLRMVTALHDRGIMPDRPVFLDIEQSTYEASPSGAARHWERWQTIMRRAEYLHAYPYVPWSAQTGWVAKWQSGTPHALPTGVIGWQFAGNAGGGKYDLSEFAASLLEVETMALSADDKQFITDTVGKAVEALVKTLSNYQYDNWTKYPQPYANKHLMEQIKLARSDIANMPKPSVGDLDAQSVIEALGRALTAPHTD